MREKTPEPRCLILACGNPLRGDDGAAWRLAELAQPQLPSSVRVILQQQWTPELAEDIARADAALFVDCSLAAQPGSVTLESVTAATAFPSFLSHHVDAASLLRLSESLYGLVPATANLLLIGAFSLEHTEELSPAVKAAMPQALELLLGWARNQTEDRPI
jgi:hydrogenase maturation protease